MNNPEKDKEREQQALDALIVAAFKQDDCAVDDDGIEKLRQEMSAEDQQALDRALGPNFIDALFSGGVKKRTKTERGALQSAMNRGDKDDDEPLTDKAQAEMDEKIRLEEEKRKAEDERRKGRDEQ